MVNGTSFLTTANLEDSFSDIARFDPLFFSFRPRELQERCDAVMRNPADHLEMSRAFSRLYHERFPVKEFVDTLDRLAKLASTFRA